MFLSIRNCFAIPMEAMGRVWYIYLLIYQSFWGLEPNQGIPNPTCGIACSARHTVQTRAVFGRKVGQTDGRCSFLVGWGFWRFRNCEESLEIKWPCVYDCCLWFQMLFWPFAISFKMNMKTLFDWNFSGTPLNSWGAIASSLGKS